MKVNKKIVSRLVATGASLAAFLSSATIASAQNALQQCVAACNGQPVCIQGCAGGGGNTNVGTPIVAGTGYASNIGSIINFSLQVVMVIALLLVFGFLIMGGIEWITSGGEKSKTESARNKITAAVVGLVILAASYAILQLMLKFLGFSSLTNAINNVNPIQ